MLKLHLIPSLTPEQAERHRQHVRKGLIHIALICFSIDAAGALFLYQWLHAEAFYSDCGKSGAVFATISCYLEG